MVACCGGMALACVAPALAGGSVALGATVPGWAVPCGCTTVWGLPAATPCVAAGPVLWCSWLACSAARSSCTASASEQAHALVSNSNGCIRCRSPWARPCRPLSSWSPCPSRRSRSASRLAMHDPRDHDRGPDFGLFHLELSGCGCELAAVQSTPGSLGLLLRACC